MKVALVYDRVNKIGGAERILLSLHELYPNAPLYTAVYDSDKASWANGIDVRPTWMQYIPFAQSHHEFYPWLTPFAFESIDFDNFDLVISVTSAEAKSIITKPKTKHICYCLTPTRYLWSGFNLYVKTANISSFFLKLFLPILRTWDLVASSRPDKYIAISNRVKKRIKRYYQRSTDVVIYPPVDTDTFIPTNTSSGEYYLLVSRLVAYKRADIVIKAFNELRLPLLVIGEGSEKRKLMELAKGNITFSGGNLTDKDVASYYQKCKAFVFAGDEDFGIVAAEANACGKPVIAYSQSGIAEIIQDGKTGVLFDQQTTKSLIEGIKKSMTIQFSEDECRENALCFDTKRFKQEFRAYVETVYNSSL